MAKPSITLPFLKSASLQFVANLILNFTEPHTYKLNKFKFEAKFKLNRGYNSIELVCDEGLLFLKLT
jgi:hypothetical protein